MTSRSAGGEHGCDHTDQPGHHPAADPQHRHPERVDLTAEITTKLCAHLTNINSQLADVGIHPFEAGVNPPCEVIEALVRPCDSLHSTSG
jgi:hypothetical protein